MKTFILFCLLASPLHATLGPSMENRYGHMHRAWVAQLHGHGHVHPPKHGPFWFKHKVVNP